MIRLFWIFLFAPLVELYLLLWLAEKTSGWFAFGVVIVTGISGVLLIRWVGLRTLSRLQADLRQQKLPTDALWDGAMILTAGLMLLVPGLITDSIGLLLLFPPSRYWIRKGLVHSFRGRFKTTEQFQAEGFSTWTETRDRIIDVRVEPLKSLEEDPDKE